MSEQQFSVAIVKGPSAGAVLRTRRKRIAVGSAPDNDLVVADDEIPPRHFIILIDEDRWRLHILTSDPAIGTDSRWQHPTEGTRGSRITLASSEIILYPGFLDDDVIQREIGARSKGRAPPTASPRDVDRGAPLAPTPMDSQARGDTTEPVPMSPGATGGENWGRGGQVPRKTPTTGPRANKIEVRPEEQTLPDRKSALGSELDLVKLSQMQTITGERPPDSLIAAAKVRLSDERTPINRMEAPLLSEMEIPEATETVIHRRSWDGAKPQDPTVAAPWPPSRGRPKAQSAGEIVEEGIPAVIDPGYSSTPLASDPRRRGSAKEPRRATARGAAPLSEADDSPYEARVSQDRAHDSARTRSVQLVSLSRHEQGGEGSGRDQRLPRVSDRAPESARQSLGLGLGDDRSGPGGAARAGHTINPQDLARRLPDPALAVIQDPDGGFSTAIRLLGTRVDEFVRRLGYRAYMLTSCEPLTGKTTSIMNLAFALAEDTHRRVALIEANFRHPRFAEILGLPEADGILPVLQGRSDLARSVAKLSDRNLVILPSGGRHPHPAEVLASPRFKTLIAELANTVDVALIDAPSIRPFADANLLQPLVDGVLVVVAEASTPGVWLTQASSQIGENRVLGAVYNRIPPKATRTLNKLRTRRMRQARS